MKIIKTNILLLVIILIGSSASTVVSAGTIHHRPAKLTLCKGRFALCASSTGTLSGRDITVIAPPVAPSKYGKEVTFPETTVICPIVDGTSIAYLNTGTMGNSCNAPEGKVYSLFAPKFHYPQEAVNFLTNTGNPTTSLEATKMVLQDCAPQPLTITTPSFPSGGNTQAISQCWSMVCEIGDVINGTPTANCSCPLGESPQGGLITPTISSVTGAGQGNPTACEQNPVSAPLQNQ